MEVLDRVYRTFSNLDRDYARSKKSRSEFITDKFGGDIDIGSMIILDAVSSLSGNETVEDIEKLTFIKNIFAKIKDSREILDSLPDFSFSNVELYSNIRNLLTESWETGTRQHVVPQSFHIGEHTKHVHYVCTDTGATYTPLSQCKVLNVYNLYTQALYSNAFSSSSPVVEGEYYVVKNGTFLEKIDKRKLKSYLK